MDVPNTNEPEIMIRYGHLDAHARDRVLDQFYLTYHAGMSSGAYLVNRTIGMVAAFLATAIPAGFLSAKCAQSLGMSPSDAVMFLYATILLVEVGFFGVMFSNRTKTRYKEHPMQTTELGMTASRLSLHSRYIHGGVVKTTMAWKDVSTLTVRETGDSTAIELTDIRGKKIALLLDCIQTIEERQILRHFLLSRLPQVDVAEAGKVLTRVGTANDVPFTKLWSQALQDARPRMRTSVLAQHTSLQNGTYVVENLIASGGQGAVYLSAMRTIDGVKEVVLKEYVLPDTVHQAEHKSAVEQFEHEVRLLTRIDHPGVIKMFDAFVEDHRAYLVLEHIHGLSLKDCVTANGPIEEKRAIQLGLQMCDILHILHTQTPSVMHLDFSPDNMLIDDHDRLTTIDFNVSIEENAIRTRTVMGKQRYMSPEQYRGKPTQRSDIYALGASIFFLLTGSEPHPISVSDPANASDALRAVLRKATALEESDRYQSAEELRSALLGLADDAGVFLNVAVKEPTHAS
jgi:tRNA A-37 threonylcarbamoyl transferase component Bud32